MLPLQQADVSAKGSAVREAKDIGDKAAVDAALAALMASKAEMAAAEEVLSMRAGLPLAADGRVDCTADFFGEAAYLTVSGQLNGEMYACALSDIYTFGPTFRQVVHRGVHGEKEVAGARLMLQSLGRKSLQSQGKAHQAQKQWPAFYPASISCGKQPPMQGPSSPASGR